MLFDVQLGLFLDGVYIQTDSGHCRFRCTPPPTVEQLQQLLHQISDRVGHFLERRGILERDEDNSYLRLDCKHPRFRCTPN